MRNISFFRVKGFTLVELIVVITIIGIISTIGFVSYSGYLVGARDTNRIATMTKAVNIFQQYATSKRLPLPDDVITITSSGAVVGYQGKIGEDVLETLEMDDDTRDPKDETYYTYFLGVNKKSFQFIAFMEEMVNSFTLLDSTYSNNEDRYPRTFGTSLGIIAEQSTNLPLEDLVIPSSTLELTDVGNTHVLSSYLSGEDYVTGTGTVFSKLGDLIVKKGKGWRVVDNTFQCFDVNNDGRCGSSNGSSIYPPNVFVSTWDTQGTGEIEISVSGGGNNYDIYYEKLDDASINGIVPGNTGTTTFTVADGQYRIEITGVFKTLYLNAGSEADRLISIEQWGNVGWTTLSNSFKGAVNLISVPNSTIGLENVSSMNEAFRDATSFNANISGWNISNISDMEQAFQGASSFNADISSWNTSSVMNMDSLFRDAISFNQNLLSWCVTNITSEPNNFDNNTPSWSKTSRQPNWGTCP